MKVEFKKRIFDIINTSSIEHPFLLKWKTSNLLFKKGFLFINYTDTKPYQSYEDKNCIIRSDGNGMIDVYLNGSKSKMNEKELVLFMKSYVCN